MGKVNINATVRFKPSDEFKFSYFLRYNHDIPMNKDGFAEFSLWQLIGCTDIYAGHTPFEDGYLYIDDKDICDDDYDPDEQIRRILDEISRGG